MIKKKNMGEHNSIAKSEFCIKKFTQLLIINAVKDVFAWKDIHDLPMILLLNLSKMGDIV